MPEGDVLCPVHGDAALDPNNTTGASMSCRGCAQVAARLGQLQALARALPVHLPPAIDADVIRARIVASAPTFVARSNGGGRGPSRGTRMTRVRWGLGLGLLAGAAVAVIGFVARPRGDSGPASAQRSVPVAGATAAAVNPSEPAQPPARAAVPSPSVTTTTAPVVAVRKNVPARRNGVQRASTDGAPAAKNEESRPSPVVGVVETTAPSPAPVPDQLAPPAPAPTANPAGPEMARDQRSLQGPVANGGGQSNPGPPAAATASVRSAIVSAPASQAAEPVTDPSARDDRAQDRAQRRQEMRERRREERIRRVERRR